MFLRSFGAIATAMLLCPLVAFASQPLELEIYDRSRDCVLPVYWHKGKRHIAGEPGHEYEIRIRNRGYGRVLAVTSVDGINVITGRTASPDQSGYVLGGHERIDIDGWRKSLEQVAAFYFTDLADSYAARTGRPENVGVIGVALFRERFAFVEPQVRQSAAPDAPTGVTNEKAADARAGGAYAAPRLGTGHGQRRDSGAVYTDFERATEKPEEIIRIFYDSERNLIAQGVIPQPNHRFAERTPDPFPGAFVPDP